MQDFIKSKPAVSEEAKKGIYQEWVAWRRESEDLVTLQLPVAAVVAVCVGTAEHEVYLLECLKAANLVIVVAKFAVHGFPLPKLCHDY